MCVCVKRHRYFSLFGRNLWLLTWTDLNFKLLRNVISEIKISIIEQNEIMFQSNLLINVVEFMFFFFEIIDYEQCRPIKS